jgi:uncharacterized protein (TIGR02231 family)
VIGQEATTSLKTLRQNDPQVEPNQVDASTSIVTNAKIIDVTLSLDTALVTREADIPADANLAVFDFGTLPVNVIHDTVHARTSEGLVLDSLLIREKEKEEREKQLDSLRKELDLLEREQLELQASVTVIDRQLTLIDRTLDFSKLQGTSDLQRGALDTQSLKSMLEFGMDKQSKLSHEKHKSTERLLEIDKTLLNVRQRISHLEYRSNHRFDVLATLRNETKLPGKVKLTYFVKHCSWEPAHELRYNSQSQKFGLQMMAKISQNSGEDWSNVQLHLAGDSSVTKNEKPVLVPLQVRSSKQIASENRSTSDNKNASKADNPDETELNEIREEWNDMSHGDSNSERNRRALLRQESELRNIAQRISLLAGDGDDSAGDFSISLDRPVSLTSQSVAQSIEVSNISLAGSIAHTAAPLLSSFAYREVEFQDGIEQSLLGGVVRVYEDEKLIGQSSLRSTQSGQPFSIGMGPDAKVRVRRELVSKAKDMQGGNVREEQSIKLVVANYHANPIRVRLFDRIPLSTDQQNVAIEYAKSSPALSADPLYRRTLFPRNILRWDLEVPASQFGAHAFDHSYAFQMVHDKSLELSIAFRQVSSDLEELDELLYDLEVMSGGGGMGGGMGGMMGR